jgi:hypothetical protein
MTDKPARFGPLTTRQLLSRLLDEPRLVEVVQGLEPGVLAGLIERIGLEDSSELISLATTSQLVQLLDEDLWKSERPGVDEAFDADRFALWLEVLLEAGEEFTAGKLAEWPEDLVMLALYEHVLVINMDELAIEMAGRNPDVDLTEKALDSCLYQEIAEFQVISRRHAGWSAILAVLLALDENHHDFLRRILERCCALSKEYIEDNDGLYHVLTSGEMLESDAAADREERRAARGYISPSSAAGFLKLARATDLAMIIGSNRPDPVTRAYFRDLERGPGDTAPEPGPPRARKKILTVLHEAGILEEARPPLLLDDPSAAGVKNEGALFGRAIARLRGLDPARYARRMEELAYLANVLIAGHGVDGRRYRPFEAAEAAVAVCNLGLEHLLGETGGAGDDAERRAARLVGEESAVKLFRVGWHLKGRSQ